MPDPTRPQGPPSGPPAYTKYRVGPRLPGRDRSAGATPLGQRRGSPERDQRSVHGGRRSLSRGRVARLIALALAAWIALSLVVFLVSAQIQQGKVADATSKVLGGGGVPPFSPTTVLVLGSDKRTKGTSEPGASTSGPSRSDSILLLRIGGGHNARLSIPRDTVVDIPGSGRNKINAAFAIGGSALAVKTVERYLGLQVNHLVEVSFDNFPDLIDALGGVDYSGGCVVSKINGGFKNGGFTLRLKRGTTRLNGKQALALARTRHNLCNAREDDRTRARRQQKIFAAMKSRLVSPGAFVRAPLVSWSAPKALRSDMSGPTLLGLFAALATSGSPAPRILRPSSDVTLPDGGSGLSVSDAERRRAVRRFLHG
jgi:LCP family protein required for cell wall assembly